MNNYLLAIGCNEYDCESIENLSGAENDASNIYNCLVESEHSIYSQTISQCLKSPTLKELRDKLENILFESTPPDIFTLFFAGHGGVVDSTYYLLPKDSKSDRLSLSAISLSEIFRIMSSSDVKHVNLVIDACNTGGLVNDLISIIKPEILGKKGSMGVSILAAAASDESAMEKNGEGVFTSNLIKFINGEKKISSETEYLDLVTLGKSIADTFNTEGIKQTSSAWGLNLFGPSIFAKNLFFSTADTIGIHNFSYIPTMSSLGRTLESFKNELWKYYEDIDTTSDYSALLHLMQSIFNEINSDEKILFIRGVCYRFIEKIDNNLSMKKLELINIFQSLLLPFLNEPTLQDEAKRLTDYFAYYGHQSITEINDNIDLDENFLIDKNEMHSNYYFLPIRISKLFALTSQLLLINDKSLEEVLRLINNVKKHYHCHFKVINDSQAASLYIFFKAFSKLNLHEHVQDIFKNYIDDFLSTKGNIAKLHINPDETFQYIFQRYFQSDINTNLLAIPSQTGAVFILLSKEYQLEQDLNLTMHNLDRKVFLLFIPQNLNNFALPLIPEGKNLLFHCGLNFWKVEEFLALYEANIESIVDGTDKLLEICCIASSYIQPNRISLMLIAKP